MLLAPYLGGSLLAAEVYKTVDAAGHVVYSDRPDPAAQKIDVHVDEPQATEVARIVKEQKLLEVEDRERKRIAALEGSKKAQREHDQELRCENAQSRYYRLKDARLLYGRDADGNRVIFSDQDADAQRSAAQQIMQVECGS